LPRPHATFDGNAQEADFSLAVYINK